MVRTTIYLPDTLHRDIAAAAKERGTSEAELIRTAVQQQLRGASPEQPDRAFDDARSAR